jgi:hypothetical protein
MASRKDLLGGSPASPGSQPPKSRLVIIVSSLVMPRYRKMLQDRAAFPRPAVHRGRPSVSTVRLLGLSVIVLCEVGWSTLCSASAVYLAASVPPQARRAIRRRRVVFRREVPLTLTAWHPTLVMLAGCTTVEGQLRPCEPHLSASAGRVSYLSHSPVSEARRLSLGPGRSVKC